VRRRARTSFHASVLRLPSYAAGALRARSERCSGVMEAAAFLPPILPPLLPCLRKNSRTSRESLVLAM